VLASIPAHAEMEKLVPHVFFCIKIDAVSFSLNNLSRR
jgi:hypothetical protein